MTVLLNQFGGLRLHVAARSVNLRAFQLVFEAGIRYFPKRQGINLLFYKNREMKTGYNLAHGTEFCEYTPFQLACEAQGREEVLAMIESTLSNYCVV